MDRGRPAVVVIGSLNMDLTIRVPRLPGPGEAVVGSELYTAHGGKGGNQAVAAARQGARVALVGRVGRDAFGEQLRRELVTEGVDASTVHVSDLPTGVALILVDPSGQNQIAVAPGANGDVRPHDTDGVSWAAGVWAVAVLEVPDAVIAAAFARARASGGRTILNAAPSRPFEAALWRLTDLLVVNESEATALSGLHVRDIRSALAAGRRLTARGPAMVALTLGARGAVVLSGERAWHIPAVRVTAVDATAAGDAWVGAVAAGLADGQSLIAAAAAGSAAGALAASRAGARPSLPRREEVLRLAAQVAPVEVG